MGSLEKRIAELEERFARAAARDKEEAVEFALRRRDDPEAAWIEFYGEPRPELYTRYEAAVARMQAAMRAEAAGEEKEEEGAAADEYLDALAEVDELRGQLRERSRELREQAQND